ncbi:hypothetical protein M409DRAFT_69459 [Zasmidium cellare ATCC 36951]|uniref:non-specific serine/threonine protein kinase n=1 Tax=Zasmidium cellare ATCC 36951 TaxID=1080233 RepID=A0A6A6C8G4_ZASCE|nr:uncharacterized protein M409DRAFT_69459 [Zasmidium cellare ATCC 36951]KAF2161949.1 hypothetical protein M409DRAFT_69459 [Zasmidium cellare ATCC 36951]
MAGESMTDRGRKASDPPSDNDDNAPLIRSDTAPSSGGPSTNTSRKSSFSSLFKGFGSHRRTGSRKHRSPPHSAGDLYSRPRTPLSPGAIDRFFETPTPARSRSSSVLGSKHPSGRPRFHVRARSARSAVTFGPSQSVADSSSLQNPKKAARAAYPRPDRPNVLDKDDTNKLNKFWHLSEEQAREETANRARASAEHSARQPGLHLQLPSISEHPGDNVGSLPRSNMDNSLLTPGSRLLADQADKQRRVQDAKDMYATIVSNAERSDTPLPPYDFIELIGKGAFGRVYKCRDQRSGNLVAVKITKIEESEFDETVRDFQKEVSILQQLKSNNVKNVNVIHDAFDLHSQLWIVADYCTGGSVRTLMRAWEKNGKAQGLPDHFIIPIARELAIALKGMHAMHVIHRDIKGANVYITEDGALQLGDFGVVGVIDDANSKRKTVIGTPHYMPREMIEQIDGEDGDVKQGYGTEVDIWAYGCTILEMATGLPPMYNIPQHNIAQNMETKGAPRLEGTEHSTELCDFVAFCLQLDPKARPTADAILKHPLIANTSKQYPTSSLVKLIEKFKIWEHGGGSRSSLWVAGPSDAARGITGDNEDEQPSNNDDFDDWNFSTSDDFDKRFSQMPRIQDGDLSYLQAPEGAGLPPGLPPLNTQNISVAERIKREHSELSANRGERSLARVFNTNDDAGYQLTSPPMEETPPPPEPSPPSDLPLRNFTSNAPTRESMIEIDLNEADVNETATSTFALHMDAINENTIKPAQRKAGFDEEDDDDFQYGQQEDTSKRDTMAWTFPSAAAPAAPQPKRGTMDWTFSTAEAAQPEEPSMSTTAGGGDDLLPGFRANLNRTATEPIGHFRGFSHDGGSSAASPNRDSVASMIDLDMGMVDPPRHLEDPAEIVRPSTASSAAGSTMTDMTSGNPFDLEEDPIQNEIDRNRFSYHKQWQSEGGRGNRNSHKTMQMHARGSSLASNESGAENNHMATSNGSLGEPMAPSAVFDNGLSLEQDDANQWPNFSTFDSFDASPSYLPTLSDVQRMNETSFGNDRNLRANGTSTRSREPSSEPPGPEVDFPDIVPPDPNALHEDADPRLLEDEFGHVLADLATALTGVEHSLRQYANVDDLDEDEPASDIESGFESNKETLTEDEGNADSPDLTVRSRS